MSNVPQLRFSEFVKEWDRKTLGSFLQDYKEKVPATTSLPIYSSSRTGLKPQKDYFDNREVKNDGEYGVVPYGYFTYRHMSDDNTFKFNINYQHPKIVVSKEYPVFTTNNLNSIFLQAKLNNGNDFKKFAITQKLGGTRTRLYFKNLCNWKTLLPELGEQEKIASFFTSVDVKIEQLTKKEELLKQYKKGVMQKIFSQEIRFRDDDGSEFPEWEEEKLGEVFSGIKGKGLSKNDIIDNGSNECILYGELYTTYSEVIKEVFSKTNSNAGVKSIKGDLLVPCSTTTTGIDLADVTVLYKNDVLLGGDITILRFKDKGNSTFFAYYLTHYKKHHLAKYGQGSTIVHMYYSHIRNMNIKYPSSIEEQTKIANFLTSIESKIEQVQKQLGSTKEFKKALLQQMFV